MKLLAILALVATSFLPVLPAVAVPKTSCPLSSSTPNEGSSLTSTSEGGNETSCR